jgi:hypothetical protein
MRRFAWFACFGFLALQGAGAMAQSPQAYWPADAKVFFVEPANGAVVTGPVKVVMGIKGVEIAPAGTEKANTGHHHILIDTTIPKGDAAEYPIPADDNHKHFGKGQTETALTLAPGVHTLQLLVGDGNHIPHDPALASDKITITVK